MTGRTSRGFTLLELLVVIAILVVLAGAAVPLYVQSKKKADIDMAKVAIGPNGTLTTTLDIFYTHMNRNPTTEEGLAALQIKPEGGDDADLENWAGPYLKLGVKLKDPWGTDYQYECPGKNNTEGFDLSSAGPDKEHGTDDDIVNWTTEEGPGT